MNNLSLFHIIRESSLKQNAPLLLLFHGYGSDENDLFSFAHELPKELFIISVKAPYPMQPQGNAWYAINFDQERGKWNDEKQAKASRDLIYKFIDEVLINYPVNKDNITLLGFSQGAILSYAVALTYPEKINNVIALSGYIDNDLFEIKNKDRYTHLNFYCSHGSADQVIPVHWARQSAPFLSALDIKHQYTEFPSGHGVAPQNFYELKNWLEQLI